MNKTETLSTLKLLKAAYPAFYSKMTRKDADGIVDLWAEMFAEDDVNIVKLSLKDLFESHSGYPPDIAAIKARVKEIIATATGEPTSEELWIILKKAVSNGTYGAKEEYEKLPPALKRYVGSPSGLKELSTLEEDIFNTVTRGQFYKQIEIAKQRQKFNDSLPEGVKDLIRGVLGQPIKEIAELKEAVLSQIDEADKRMDDRMEKIKEGK